MTTKYISFSREHFQRKKHHPLTSLMISTLLAAREKQKEGALLVLDIKGSFTDLIKRGLIVSKDVIINKHTSLWQVTTEAIAVLKAIGIKVSC